MKTRPEVDLFSPVVQREKQHPQFLALRESELHGGARALMNALFGRMGDPNGQFIRHFQGDAFHARLFELSCFAYLEEAGLTIDRSRKRPDFLAYARDRGIAIEAVTSNPGSGQGTDISLEHMELVTEREVFARANREFPHRFVRSLEKKLAHRYHELAHCRGKPLVLMIAPFFEAGANFYTEDALFYPLFGPPEGIADTVLPFFKREEATPISAILYCNQFTVSRYLRLATDFMMENAPKGVRQGFFYHEHDEDTHALRAFKHRLGAPEIPRESWSEGVTIFENPFADMPLPPGTLPATCTVAVRDGYVTREVGEFHPIVSFTVMGNVD